MEQKAITKDNRGMTLVELMIAIAMSVIILGAVTALMRTAQTDYKYTQTTVNLQTEGQVLMEQIAMWVQEGNKLEVDTTTGGLVIWDAAAAVSTNRPAGAAAVTDTTGKRLIWQTGGKLYLKTFTGIDTDNTETAAADGSDATEDACIGDYVSDISFTLNTVDSVTNSVTVKVKLKQAGQSYTLTDTFKMRNKAVS